MDLQEHSHISGDSATHGSYGQPPVVSVDTKKKELVGNHKNDGRKWHAKDEGLRVQGHDFPHPDVPRAYPYGIYDLARRTVEGL
jgi:hypothetical protein